MAQRVTPAPTPPNILWICTDQQRADTISALGNPHIRTPMLDSLVRDGVALRNAYCQSPICSPSRASFMTGRYPSSIRATANGQERWAGAASLVSKLLADGGYDCHLVGKLHLSRAEGRVEARTDDGFRTFQWSHGPQNRWGRGNAYSAWLADRGVPPAGIADPASLPPELHHSRWCGEAVSTCTEQARPPWLICMNTYDPHYRFDPPPEYRARYDAATLPPPLFRDSDLAAQERLTPIGFQTPPLRPQERGMQEIKAAYYAMIELLDDVIGSVLAALDRTGQRDDTLILFMSDHGEMLGDHGLLLKGCRFYEGLAKVPLLFSWPRGRARGVVSDALVELVDIAPTLLEIAGLEPPSVLHGRSLLPLLRGDRAGDEHRSPVRCEYYRALNPRPRAATPPLDASLIRPSYATMVRDARYKLVTYHGTGLGELFDLYTDPAEFHNRWHDPPLAAVRHDLLLQSLDVIALSTDLGPPQTADY